MLEAHAGFVRAGLPGAAAGDGVEVYAGPSRLRGVIRAVSRDSATIVLSDSIDGIVPGDEVRVAPEALTMPLGMGILGRVIDGSGRPLDAKGPLRSRLMRVETGAPPPDERVAVSSMFWTGIKAIDGLLPFGRGARIGVFGQPGAGKSTLLSLLSKGAHSDAVVVGLIGERGREAAEWMQRCNGRMTVVCASSDRSAAERIAAGRAAVAQAGALRALGLNVLLIIDSLARYGAALREVAVASGEPVGRGGFPAGVFAQLARLVETAGCTRRGSVTMVATVLCDGPADGDPLSEAARSLLDGHIVLSQTLANAGRYPAIDVLASASRTIGQVASPEQLRAARTVREALAALAQSADARSLGLPIADPGTLRAQAGEASIEAFVRQGELCIKPAVTLADLASLADILEERSWTSQPI